jgi:hypothetical protein
MGARETAIETASGGRTTIRWTRDALPGFAQGTALPARWYKETLEPTAAAARVVAQFEDGAAAAVMSTFGKGKTLMLGSYVSASAQSTPTPESQRFFAALLDWAGVSLPVHVSGSPVEVRHTESGRDAVLFVFNHAKEAAASEISLARSAGNYAVTDLTNGAAVTPGRSKDAVTLRLNLPPLGVRVLRVSPRQP